MDNGLCKYKNIFGEPGTGVHSIRLFNIAVVDVIGTIILAVIFSKITKINLLVSMLLMFILGIIVHRIFCVNTTVGKKVFPSKATEN